MKILERVFGKKLTPKIKSFTSTDVKNDLNTTFKGVLDELENIENKASEIKSLEEALETFNKENSTIKGRIENLERLGFENTPSVTTLKTKLKAKEELIKSEIGSIERRIEKVNHIEECRAECALKFPGLKFIDFDTMVAVMKKYKIYAGDISLYNKEVPQHAIESIEKVYDKYVKPSERATYLVIDTRYRADIDFNSKPVNFGNCKNYPLKSSDLKIVAPIGHFKLTVDTTIGRLPVYKISDNNFIVPQSSKTLKKWIVENIPSDDPILILGVRGGFVILDAWDEEAKIPEIYNPKMN